VVDREKVKAHGGGSNSKEWQPMKMDLELNLDKKTPRFDQARSGWWCM
jgi:hypothetical protein